jgi:hypothetical protein
MSERSAPTGYLPTNTLLKALFVFLLIFVVLDIGGIVNQILDLGIISRAIAGQPATEAEAQGSAVRALAWLGINVVMLLGAAVVFLTLVGRLNHNARILGAERLSQSPGFAVGCYFIPIANIWLPYQGMQEIWKVAMHGPEKWKRGDGSTLVGVWWLLRIGSVVFDRVVIGMAGSNDLSVLQSACYAAMIVMMTQIILCYLTWQVFSGACRLMDAQNLNASMGKGTCPQCGESVKDFLMDCPMCGAAVKNKASIVV